MLECCQVNECHVLVWFIVAGLLINCKTVKLVSLGDPWSIVVPSGSASPRENRTLQGSPQHYLEINIVCGGTINFRVIVFHFSVYSTYLRLILLLTTYEYSTYADHDVSYSIECGCGNYSLTFVFIVYKPGSDKFLRMMRIRSEFDVTKFATNSQES